MVDPVTGLIALPLTLVMWLVALAVFGMLMAAVSFVVAAYSLFQRYNMNRDMKKYVELLTQANTYAYYLDKKKVSTKALVEPER